MPIKDINNNLIVSTTACDFVAMDFTTFKVYFVFNVSKLGKRIRIMMMMNIISIQHNTQ